ncbi:Electron transfer flavoprotein small subunit [Aedoeadaptatus ivorii]|uniref:Electron transfer flavoprotein small subunit n=1 Tax=Aedoeadaptatus ivorii TaxID=54006 RepID=A0A448V205_9FIRM|nr:electron transfer flavoprotein subunit beta/FixA family protein [Peptoniphilus ivorii]VEJ35866.1 Electron transfer flavoprotein small subunit [Peptoniphilus ivorii]
MKIIVCVKQVPDTTEVRLDPKTNTLIRDGVPSIINPDDKAGVEAVLRIKDEYPNTHVTVLSMGPPQAEDALRETLAMGADEAILLSDRAFGGADTWATSTTIAAGLKNVGDYDLIVTGRQAIDGDTAQVGPQIAEHLGLPQVSYAEGLELIDENTIHVKRQFEDRYHKVEIKTPCVITALAELAEPRYMTVSGVFDAYEKDIAVWGLDDIKEHLNIDHIGLKGSPTKVKKSYAKEGKGAGIKMTDLSADEAAKAIVSKLEEKFII